MKFLSPAVIGLILLANFGYAESAKYEPVSGIYLGVVLDWADLATMGKGENGIEKFVNGINDFNFKTQRKHALIEQFIFFPHGAPFEDEAIKGRFPTWDSDPAGWATAKEFCEAAGKVGATPILTLEPWIFETFYMQWDDRNLAYKATKEFALACANFKKPIFIRFAHEMNGSWYPWCTWIDKNKNLKKDKDEETGIRPEDYVAAFRNVAAIFRQYAPNVAIIWCPNQGWLGSKRADNYTRFYPGDTYVDWVGLDFYERGWYQPDLKKKLWGGLFGYGLTNDSLDDPNTKENESVNFYETYCIKKNKPLMICETGATLTYRIDLSSDERQKLSRNWKGVWWNPGEYGWIMGVYGTSYFDNLKHNYSIDKEFPNLKAIVWFNMAKVEDMPTVKKQDGKEEVIWFNNGFCDYRIGYDATSPANKYAPESQSPEQIELYKDLIKNSHFLSEIR